MDSSVSSPSRVTLPADVLTRTRLRIVVTALSDVCGQALRWAAANPNLGRFDCCGLARLFLDCVQICDNVHDDLEKLQSRLLTAVATLQKPPAQLTGKAKNALEPVQSGSIVEYYSRSLSSWIVAEVRTVRADGYYDLDRKEKVAPENIRPTLNGASASMLATARREAWSAGSTMGPYVLVGEDGARYWTRAYHGPGDLEEPPRTLDLKASAYATSACIGAYELVPGRFVNGFPLWQQKGGNHWLFTGVSGQWLVGDANEELQKFKCDSGLVASLSSHDGEMPHKITSAGSWLILLDGAKWEPNPSLRFVLREEQTSKKEEPAINSPDEFCLELERILLNRWNSNDQIIALKEELRLDVANAKTSLDLQKGLIEDARKTLAKERETFSKVAAGIEKTGAMELLIKEEARSYPSPISRHRQVGRNARSERIQDVSRNVDWNVAIPAASPKPGRKEDAHRHVVQRSVGLANRSPRRPQAAVIPAPKPAKLHSTNVEVVVQEESATNRSGSQFPPEARSTPEEQGAVDLAAAFGTSTVHFNVKGKEEEEPSSQDKRRIETEGQGTVDLAGAFGTSTVHFDVQGKEKEEPSSQDKRKIETEEQATADLSGAFGASTVHFDVNGWEKEEPSSKDKRKTETASVNTAANGNSDSRANSAQTKRILKTRVNLANSSDSDSPSPSPTQAKGKVKTAPAK